MKPPEGMTISPRPRLWCLTHDCWDGDCGVIGQHEVEPRHEVAVEIAWARWPWQTCVAVTLDVYGKCRCDLKKGHAGAHRAERGTYDVVWPAGYGMVDR